MLPAQRAAHNSGSATNPERGAMLIGAWLHFIDHLTTQLETRMLKVIRTIPLLLIAAAAACGTPRQAPPQEQAAAPATETPTAQVRESMLVSADWLAGRLEDKNVIVLHVAANPKGYEAGHIPGAHYLGWKRLVRTVGGVANELPPLEDLTELVRGFGIERGKRVVIYDEGSGIVAARAYFTLDYLGLGDNSSLLDGQLALWKAEGRPLSVQTPPAVRSTFEPAVNEQVLIGMSELLATLGGNGPEPTLLDCRPPDRFGAGHIPGARNLSALAPIVSPEKPLLLSAAKLRELYRRAGTAEDRPVVAYCRTGRTASLNYFTLKYLGYDVRLYDGSFSQWRGVENNPIETGG